MTLAIRAGWTIVAVALAYLRLSGEKGEAFQAVAHLCVGGWFAAWAVLIAVRHLLARFEAAALDHGAKLAADMLKNCRAVIRPGWYGWLFLATSLVEVHAFLAGRFPNGA